MAAMRPLTSVHGSFGAHLLAARLRSEGIDVELRGALNSPYGLTVGEMARVDLFVPEDQLEDASLVLIATEVDDALAAPQEWGDVGEPPRARRGVALVALALLAAAGLALVLRVVPSW